MGSAQDDKGCRGHQSAPPLGRWTEVPPAKAHCQAYCRCERPRHPRPERHATGGRCHGAGATRGGARSAWGREGAPPIRHLGEGGRRGGSTQQGRPCPRPPPHTLLALSPSNRDACGGAAAAAWRPVRGAASGRRARACARAQACRGIQCAAGWAVATSRGAASRAGMMSNSPRTSSFTPAADMAQAMMSSDASCTSSHMRLCCLLMAARRRAQGGACR